MLLEDQENPPKGEGYLFTLQGKHYHHDEKDAVNGRKFGYVKSTLLKSLQQWTVQNDEGSPAVPVRKLGITHATVVLDRSESKEVYPNGKDRPGAGVLSASRPSNAGGIGGALRVKRRILVRPGRSPNPGGGGGFGPDSGNYGQGSPSAGLLPQDGIDPRHFSEEKAKPIQVYETEFVLQFIWREIPKTERLEEQPKYEPKPKKASSKKR
jgi:type IV pilus assembly protein PilM